MRTPRVEGCEKSERWDGCSASVALARGSAWYRMRTGRAPMTLPGRGEAIRVSSRPCADRRRCDRERDRERGAQGHCHGPGHPRRRRLLSFCSQPVHRVAPRVTNLGSFLPVAIMADRAGPVEPTIGTGPEPRRTIYSSARPHSDSGHGTRKGSSPRQADNCVNPMPRAPRARRGIRRRFSSEPPHPNLVSATPMADQAARAGALSQHHLLPHLQRELERLNRPESREIPSGRHSSPWPSRSRFI